MKGRSRTMGRLAGALLAVACVGAQVVFLGGAPVAQTPGVVQVGTLPSVLSPTSRFLTADASARRLFEVGEPEDGSAPVRVVAYDADTLAAIAHIDIPQAQSSAGGRLAALDAARHRLFLTFPMAPDAAAGVIGRNETTRNTVRVMFGIAVIDTLHARLLGVRALPEIVVTARDLTKNGAGVKALTYHAPEDRLYLATENTTERIATIIPGDRSVFVHEIDASRVLDSSETGVTNWTYPVPQCAMVMHGQEGGVLLRPVGEPNLFIPCATGGVLGVPPPLDTGGVVRLRMTGGSDAGDTARFGTDFFPMSGRLETGLVTVDPAPGHERLFMRVDATSTGGESGVWVFDARNAAWLGLMVTPGGGPWGLAVDDVAGRLYSFSTGFPEPSLHTRVAVASTRTQLADQGVVTDAAIDAEPVIRRPVVDHVTHRLYWEAGGGYLILEDRLPVREPPAAADPDAQTADLEDGLGTGVNFLGSGRAYGSRLRWVGGQGGVQRNVVTVLEDDPKSFVRSFLPPDLLGSVGAIEATLPPDPQGGTRDYHFGRVLRATLSNGEASAESTGADRDIRNTDTDLANWTAYLADAGGPDMTGERWPYGMAKCIDFGGSPGTDAETGASTSCRHSGNQVIASAVNEGPWNIGPIQVGDSKADSYTVRDPERGIVSVATAEVKDLDVLGLVGAGRIIARAETWAKGRPGTAGSVYTPYFQDVWVMENGQRRIVCGSNCDPRQVGAAFSTIVSSRLQVAFPSPDEARRATPGGFEALVVRDPFQIANDTSVNDETDVRLEVPALEITLVSDGRVRSRIVASLAAVAAESHYGLFALGDVLPPASGPRVLGAPASAGARITRPAPAPDAPPGVLPYADGGGLSRFVRKVFEGLRFFFASPAHMLKAAALWTILGLPLFLMMRRRSLDALTGDR